MFSPPQGRMPAPSCSLLQVDAFWKQCCQEIATSSEVELASYLYDNSSLHKALLKRLNSRQTFSLRVYVDAEMFAGQNPRFQRSRVRELMEAGAGIYLCRGPGRQGAFHCKGIVIDRKVLYCGNANATDKSLCNEEFCLRVTGAPVGQILQRLSMHLKSGRLWNGS